MKNRQGFVSNSSSSSFIILKKNLTEEQIFKIYNHISEVRKMTQENPEYERIFDVVDPYDEWNITEYEDTILAQTSMDNFNLRTFLSEIGISALDIHENY